MDAHLNIKATSSLHKVRPVILPFLINLISSLVTREQQNYYQGSSDVRNFPQAANGGVKSSQFNPQVRSQYPNPHYTNPALPPQPNNQTWNRGLSQNSSQHGHGRYSLNSNPGNGNLNAQSQNHNPKHQPQNHSQRRQSQPLRPQVRLPATPVSVSPNNGSQANQGCQINQGYQVNPDFNGSFADLKLRSTQSPNKDFQSKTKSNPVRRHRHSTSNSSKTSTEGASWDPVVSVSPSSTQFSSPESSTHESYRQPPRSQYFPDEIDKEWLLLRAETFNTPQEVQGDKYGHVHPLVRKYAAHTLPELKIGEPRWANAVMSRRWQREETLEQEKKEMLAKREQGAELPSNPPTCMTEQQYKANRLAEQTLAMLKDMDGEKNQENIDEISGEEKM